MSEELKPGLRLAKTLSAAESPGLFTELLQSIRAEQTPTQVHDFAMAPGFRDEPGIGQDFHALGEDKYDFRGQRAMQNQFAQKTSEPQEVHGIELVSHTENHPRVRHHEPEHPHICPWPRQVPQSSKLRRLAV